MGALHELYDRYRDRVAFYVVYIKEAHPEDGWVLSVNRESGIAVPDPVSEIERDEVAATCVLRLKIRMPVLLDGLDNATAKAYGGWPDRLYLIGSDGRITFQGGEGPFGFKPDELKSAIDQILS